MKTKIHKEYWGKEEEEASSQHEVWINDLGNMTYTAVWVQLAKAYFKEHLHRVRVASHFGPTLKKFYG